MWHACVLDFSIELSIHYPDSRNRTTLKKEYNFILNLFSWNQKNSKKASLCKWKLGIKNYFCRIFNSLDRVIFHYKHYFYKCYDKKPNTSKCNNQSSHTTTQQRTVFTFYLFPTLMLIILRFKPEVKSTYHLLSILYWYGINQ